MRNFFLFGLVLALVLVGEMGHFLPTGLSANKIASIEKIVQLNRGSTEEVSRYVVSGYRDGKVTVSDRVSGQVIRTFEMDEGVVVRETFLLDNGRTVGASQKDHAVFWDLATGREIGRLNRRIYGFSHNQTRFFTYSYPEGVLLYSYPDIRQLCQLTNRTSAGPGAFIFSPNDRFLVIGFASGFPSSDENYPDPDRTERGTVYTNLFNIQTCQEIRELYSLRFTYLGLSRLGEFSSDSRFYYIKDISTYNNSIRQVGTLQFDLITHEVRLIDE